jgi:hypothetical protein
MSELVSNALVRKGAVMDQVLLDQILSWLFPPFVVLADHWTTVVSGICSGLSGLRDAMHSLWTIAVFGIGVVLCWLGALPYLWLRAILGISIGLLVTRKTIGLLWCMLGNVVLFAYAGLTYGPPKIFPIALLSWSIVAFWFAGWIVRWIITRVPGGLPLVVAGAMILVGVSLLDVALHHTALAWWIVRITGIVLAVAGGIFAILGLHALWEERIALLLDDWRFRRSLRY